jgi:DNA-binding transcriptional regulator YdaS (Cro superfamily)
MSTPSLRTELAKAAREACDAAGGAAKLASAMGLFPSAITHWRQHGIPSGRVRRVSEITGISPARLRPDLFGDIAAETEAA